MYKRQVLDADGNLDLPVDRCRKSIQLVLAGIHFPLYQPADMQTHTRTWLNVCLLYTSTSKTNSPKPDGSEADCGISKNQAAAAGTRPGAGADGGNTP